MITQTTPIPELVPALNQPTPLENYDSFACDPVLSQGVAREGAAWASEELSAWGRQTGSREFLEWGRLANRYEPELQTFDRFGNRIDEVEFHPAWHHLIGAGVKAKVHSWPWLDPKPGAHVARVAAHYLLSQAEAGVGCPLTMTFAAVPALQLQPDLAKDWVPRITSTTYDFGLRAPQEKAGCLMGMAMTEKQGGSDVRANTTRAERTDEAGVYRLFGHKWFCSAPMCDAFLTLAQTEKGISCFLLPRVLPDGTRNRMHIQRLKEKLGNRSNASSEIEFQGALVHLVGELGRGVPTIIEMVNHTRLDCMIGSAAVMRAALVQALNHCRGRYAFGALLVDQPLMRQVLADLSLEWEAATVLLLRLARGYDARKGPEAAFVRLATAVGKYWVCKRGPGLVGEALECHGGAGYVEEHCMARHYREAPLTSIWEGSGNVMCLDVLRALTKSPETGEIFRQELAPALGQHPLYDEAVKELEAMMRQPSESLARQLTERMALALQAALLLQHSPRSGAAFCEARLGSGRGLVYGATAFDAATTTHLLERAWA